MNKKVKNVLIIVIATLVFMIPLYHPEADSGFDGSYSGGSSSGGFSSGSSWSGSSGSYYGGYHSGGGSSDPVIVFITLGFTLVIVAVAILSAKKLTTLMPTTALKNVPPYDPEKLKEYLPDNIKYFDENMITNRSMHFMISEIVREKILWLTKEEVPHSVTCLTEKVIKDKDKNIINVAIIVDRDSLKRIIIGKNGQMIKKIGTLARKDLEEILKTKIYLELYVKTIEKWRDKEKYLKEFNFNDFTE